jgi:hypothetical protein
MDQRRGFSLILMSVIVVVWILFSEGPVIAQVITQGSISGTVTDSSGSVVPGVKVTILNNATNVSATVTTSAHGEYVVPDLPPGTYTVTVELTGFQKAVREGVLVVVGAGTVADVRLQVGTVAQSVTVAARPLAIDQTSADRATILSPDTLAILPLEISGDQRTLEAFLWLDSSTHSTGEGDQYAFRVGGGMALSADIVADGMSFNTAFGYGITYYNKPPFEAVDEFSVEKNSYSAQYGHGSAVENFHYKSGTNAFHGDVYDFLRNNVLDARGQFAPTVGVYKQNEYGVTAGGPLYIPKVYDGRNKTFWAFTYTGFKERGGVSTSLYTAPTAKMLKGDFTELPYPIFDPATTAPDGSGGLTRQQFQCNGVLNVICPDRISKNSQAFVPLMSYATLPGVVNNSLAVVSTYPTNNYSWLLKMDENISPKYMLHGSVRRYLQNNGFNGSINGGLGQGAAFYSPMTQGQINFDQHLASNILNTTGVSYLYDNIGTTVLPTNTSVNTPISPLGVAYPGFIIPGMPEWGWGYFNPTTATPTFNIVDNLSWVRGRHILNMGTDLRWQGSDAKGMTISTGQYTFSTATTSLPDSPNFGAWGNGFAALLLGLPTGFIQQGLPPFRHMRSLYDAFYLQDDYRVTPKLTLNLGVRWDITGGLRETRDLLSTFDPNVPNPGAGNIPGAIVYAGHTGGACVSAGGASLCRDRIAPMYYKGIQPRLGFAYRLTNRTVIRGGYGIVYYPSGSTVSYGGFVDNAYNAGFPAEVSTASENGGISPIPSIDPTNLTTIGWDQGLPPVPAVSLTRTASNGGSADFWDPGSGRNPYMQNWSLTVERELPGRVALEVSYVGSKGTRLGATEENLDQVNPKWLVLGNELDADVSCLSNGTCPNSTAAGVKVPYAGFTGSIAQALRPYPQYSQINSIVQETGSSTYHALQIRVQKYLSNGLSFLASYTASKQIDNTWGLSDHPSYFGTVNTYNRKEDKNVDAGNVPNSVVVSGVYELPIGPRKQFLRTGGPIGKVLGGWQVGWIASYASGTPLNITGGPELPIFDRDNYFAFGGNVPNVVQGQKPIAYTGGKFQPTTESYLNPGAWSMPAAFTIGNTPKFDAHASSFAYYNESLSVIKKTYIKESVNVEFRAEAYNVLNRTVYGAPDQSFGTVGFGMIGSMANSPRVIQFGLKLNW